MKRWQIGGALALGIGLAAGAAAARPHARAPESVAWLGSIDEGQAAARRSNKPIFLVFR